jgi:hypothetical protein
MWNAVTAVDVIYPYIGTSLSGELTGRIYKWRRTKNSKKEDIVINCINASAYPNQRAVLNINCHVPDKVITVSGDQQLMPNSPRIEYLTNKILDALKGIVHNDYVVNILSTGVFTEGVPEQHYSNTKIEILTFLIPE